MPLFAIICEDDAPTTRLAEAISTEFPDDHFKFGPRSWFVSAEGQTSRQVCDRLGIQKGGITKTATVQLTGGYWGVANTGLWEFLKTSLERSDG